MTLRLVFFGTPKFAADILSYLIKRQASIAAVITRPDKPKGRSKEPAFSPVKELALKEGLAVCQPLKASNPDFASFLKTLEADVFVVAAYAEILKLNVLEIPRLGCLNVHGSILPKYRGAAPVHRCIMAGEKETGVTIMKMAAELDAGAICSVVKTPIAENMTAGELMDRLAELGAPALWDVLQKMEAGQLQEIPQDPSLATYAKKLHSEDGEINWNRPADEVYNHIRGVTPKPGAWVWVWVKGEKKRLLIREARKESNYQGRPGEIVSQYPHELVVACQNGGIRLKSIQLEGKKEMQADVFLRGLAQASLKFNSNST